MVLRRRTFWRRFFLQHTDYRLDIIDKYDNIAVIYYVYGLISLGSRYTYKISAALDMLISLFCGSIKTVDQLALIK